MKINAALLGALCLFASSAAAAPRVMTDIAPVQSLTARVMAGIGAPGVLLPAGASPHHYALRPSDAAALQEADLVIWIGEGLTPWLPRVLERLSGAAMLEMAEAPGVIPIAATDDMGHEETHEDGHGDGQDEAQGEVHGDDHDGAHADDHGDDHDEAHSHDHGAVDPHIWLDPANAAAMMRAAAEALAVLDPANAAAYRANAEDGAAELTALTAEIDALLAPVRGRGFVLAHDALGYFEGRFDLHAAGALADAGADRPGPARADQLRTLIAKGGIVCVFTDPAHDSALAARLAEGGAKLAALDPLGAGLPAGPALYPALMRRLATDMAACLGE